MPPKKFIEAKHIKGGSATMRSSDWVWKRLDNLPQTHHAQANRLTGSLIQMLWRTLEMIEATRRGKRQ